MFKRVRFTTVSSIGFCIFFFILVLIPNLGKAHETYYVSSQGDDSRPGNSESNAWRTIAKVSSMNFNPGDIVSFKSGQNFADAMLICKQGVTYTTYNGSAKAIIGDSLGSISTTATVQINQTGVELNNLKIYGYANASAVIKYGAGGIIIDNCEIVGGLNAHANYTVGILQAGWNGNDVTISYNKIHSLGIGIRYAAPYNYEIGCNELYDLWNTRGGADGGGYAIGTLTVLNEAGDDVYDAKYTLHIHHNNVHDFEYAFIATGVSRMLIEYNEIHHNLDDRIYFGGCKHGDIGKIFDEGISGGNGGIATIFRYNYVHDLIRRGLPNYTYARPSSLPSSSPNIVSTNNGLGVAKYLGGGSPTYGDDFEHQPASVIDGMGYHNSWIHDNIFYKCSKAIYTRMANNKSWNANLTSYFLNNTILDCGNNYATNYYGMFMTENNSNSPNTIVNNIIDFTNPNAATAGIYREEDLYLDYNIYTHQDGIKAGGWDYYPSLGSQLSAYVQGRTELSGQQHEKYLTNPGWVDSSSKIFAANIGISGAYIPNVRIKKDGNAYNTGKPYNTIGDTHTDSYGTHQLGKDPTGRSFAYDILNNLRNTNDIGAVGITSNTSTSELKVILEAPYDQGNGEMKTNLNSSNLLPVHQPYNINPWNVNDNSMISSVSVNYVDWILVQLKDNTTSTKYSKPGILTKDGVVVNSDGSAFSFSNISSGQYYIVIRHRDHISIMSSVKVQINNNEEVEYDFTDSEGKAYGENSMVDLGNGKYGMIAGDANADGVINDLDYTAVSENIFFNNYVQGDLDMNGVVNVLDYFFINKNISRSINLP